MDAMAGQVALWIGGGRILGRVTIANLPAEPQMTPMRYDPVAIARGLILFTVAIHIVFGALAANRAWVQVRRLDLKLSGRELRSGSTARVDVVSTGRAPVHLSLELIQGTRAETVAVALVRSNAHSFWDPRNKPDSMSVTFTPSVLARFTNGRLLLRATARGAPEWLRLPPPLVRDLSVALRTPVAPSP